MKPNSKDFEDFLEDAEQTELRVAQQLEEQERQELAEAQLEIDTSSISFDLRAEIYAQTTLLKAIRGHLFTPNGTPKVTTDPSDITAYMNTSMKLLGMLQAFESSLKTDEDVRRIELAIEMAMEDCPCPEFVTTLVGYLEGDEI